MSGRFVPLLGLIVVTLFSVIPGFAQPSEELKALQREIEALKQGQTAIQKDLQELKELLRARPAAPAPTPARAPDEPQDVVLSIDSAPFKGDKDAKLTLVEFSDYQCPFCARHFRQTLPQLESEYVKTGKLRYVLRDFPIASLHPQAAKGHEAAYCAGEQGKYWGMHTRLFSNPRSMAPADLTGHAKALGLDLPAFQACADGGKYAELVRKHTEEGEKAGVRGTPTFFLGFAEPSDPTKVKAVRVLRGAYPYAAFKDAIEKLLASLEQEKK